MSSESWKNSTVCLVSADARNNRFGTGFVIHRDYSSTYILTCAHVIQAIGGPDMTIADGHKARLISSGENDDVDLAIIRIDVRLDKEPLNLKSLGSKGSPVKIVGFEHILGKEYLIRELNGVLGQPIGLESRKRKTRLDAWDLIIVDDYLLQPGYSGAPIIDSESGSVIGIVRIKQGDGERGIAISTRVIEDLWPDLDYLYSRRYNEGLHCDWGDAPDVSSFFGRASELSTLKKWIIDDRCRIVSIIGMGGIGKTAITIRLVKSGFEQPELAEEEKPGIQNEFEHVIWRRLLNAQPITEVLSEIIKFVSDQQEINIPEALDEQISRLLYYLQKHHCLLILDNVEAILQSGENQAGLYREGYEGYGELFKRVGTTSHQSCLLLNSREKPIDIALLEGRIRPVRTLDLIGLNEVDGRRIFEEIGSFSGSPSEWTELIGLYNGNPLTLELAAKHINEVFFGDISMFLARGKPLFNDLYDLLDWHFNRLSDLEREVLYWLAIDREPISLLELEADILTASSQRKLTSTLQSLQRRIPLEKSSARFTLQPVLIEHVTNKLIERVIDEFVTGKISLLESHALLKALAKDYIREAQSRLILKPIKDTLLSLWGSQPELESRLTTFLSKLREEFSLKASYAGGNILNILCHLNKKLVGLDFSNLAVWQAYLQEVTLHHVSFAYSNMRNCVFTQTFGPIACQAVSPDGSLVAASESNGDIHIWRVEDLQIVTTLRGHINWIFALAFSPDGQTLASGGEDKTVRLWDLQTNKCRKVLQDHSNSVWAVAFSPNGRILATGSEDETIKIWNPTTGNCVITLKEHKRKVFSLDFSPDGQKLASASADQTVKIWDIYNWQNPITLQGHSDVVRGVAFSPDSQIVVSGSWDQTIKLWDTETGDCINTLQGHTDSVHSVAFHSNGRSLASSGESGIIRIWDVKSGKCLETLQRHVGEVWKVVFSRDSQLLVSGGYDGTLRIWDTVDWICRNTLHGYIDWVQALSISPDGQIVVGSNGDLTIRVWDIESGECHETLQGHTGWTFSLAYSPDAQKLASGSDDRTIKIWDTRTWRVINTLLGHTTWVQAVSFSADGQKLASGSDDRTIKIWDVSSGQCLQTLQGHSEGIWSVAFTADGKTLASGSEDHTIKIWDLVEGRCINTLIGHTDRIHSVSIDLEGKFLVSSSDDKTARIWDIQSGKCSVMLSGHDSWVISAKFDSTGKLVASGGKDQTVRIWDAQNGRCIKSLHGHSGGIWSVAFSPDSKSVASASEDGSIRIWDVESGKCVKVLRPLKPYENMNIWGATGLTDAQKISLKSLGAIESEDMTATIGAESNMLIKTHDYKKYAGAYAQLGIEGTYYLAFRDIPELLNKYTKGRKALDYGCGPGRSTRFLKGLDFDTVGVDISTDMLEKARLQDEYGEYHHIESGQLPFADNSFDLIFSSFVFIEVNSLEKITEILAEMKRVLKKDGVIIYVTAPAAGYEGNWVSFSYDFPENDKTFRSGDMAKLLIRGSGVILYDYYWTEQDYIQVANKVGLKLVEIHKPIGSDEDPVEWLDEAKSPYMAVYVLRKS